MRESGTRFSEPRDEDVRADDFRKTVACFRSSNSWQQWTQGSESTAQFATDTGLGIFLTV